MDRSMVVAAVDRAAGMAKSMRERREMSREKRDKYLQQLQRKEEAEQEIRRLEIQEKMGSPQSEGDFFSGEGASDWYSSFMNDVF